MKKNEKLIKTIAVIIVAALVLTAVILTAVRIKHGGTSDHYDFECLTKPSAAPLKTCKQ